MEYTVNDELFRKAKEEHLDLSSGVILPDGSYVLTKDGHLATLMVLSGVSKEELWPRIPDDISPLFYMIASLSVLITDENSTVGTVPTQAQRETFRKLVEKGVIADKYFDISGHVCGIQKQ